MRQMFGRLVDQFSQRRLSVLGRSGELIKTGRWVHLVVSLSQTDAIVELYSRNSRKSSKLFDQKTSNVQTTCHRDSLTLLYIITHKVKGTGDIQSIGKQRK